jgi:tryptophan synthase alpha chain
VGLFRKDESIRQDVGGVVAEGAAGARSLAAAFASGRAEARALLMPFLVAGFPTGDAFVAAAEAAGTAGADVIEVGIPFSDPIMDGPVIAGAATRVLAGGQTLDEALSLVARAATAFGGSVVVMTYYNLLFHRGLGEIAGRLADAGVAGVIVPDLSVEESSAWCFACEHAGLAPVFLAAPTSTEERLHAIAGASEGFIYAASTLGVTGVREQLSARARDLVSRLRAVTETPVAVGIGVSTPDHVREVGSYADGVIVGSALVRAMGGAADPARAAGDLIRALRSATAAP